MQPVVDVIKPFWRKSGKSRNSKNMPMLKVIKDFKSLVLLENSIVFTFQCRFSHQNKKFQFINFAEIYSIDYQSKNVLIGCTNQKCARGTTVQIG